MNAFSLYEYTAQKATQFQPGVFFQNVHCLLLRIILKFTNLPLYTISFAFNLVQCTKNFKKIEKILKPGENPASNMKEHYINY